MSDEKSLAEPQLPQAEIHQNRGFSLIWVVPLIALVIGIWMGYQAWSEQGPTITISFANAEGLEKDKTRVKYKEVDIGKVVDIRLSDDLARVLVKVEMDRTATNYLTDNTHFWVVRARITVGEISGLSTLLSGAYIGMEPGKTDPKGKLRTRFEGLESAPVQTGTQPGEHFLLHAANLDSIDVGYPVYYRKVQVGQVVSYTLDPVRDRVDIQVFIRAPYHKKVGPETRFYQVSGIDIELGAGGLKISSNSLISILLGGIAFETPAKLDTTRLLTRTTEFELYPDRGSINQRSYQVKERYLLTFEDSVKGLRVGAPVEFHGIKIGKVLDIALNFDETTNKFTVPVLVEIEPERLLEINPARKAGASLMDYLVRQGLRGQLMTGSLLTGQLFVNLEIFPAITPATMKGERNYPEIPTLSQPPSLEQLLARADSLLTSLEKIPIAELSEGLKQTLGSLNDNLQQSKLILGQLNREALPEMVQTMRRFQASVKALEESYKADSPIGRETYKTLSELEKAARSVRVLSDYLQAHPETLLRGKEAKP